VTDRVSEGVAPETATHAGKRRNSSSQFLLDVARFAVKGGLLEENRASVPRREEKKNLESEKRRERKERKGKKKKRGKLEWG